MANSNKVHPTVPPQRQEADRLKEQGNQLLGSGDRKGAVEAYSRAIAVDPKNHVYYSNRSVVYLELGSLEEALADAEECVSLSPTWAKSHARKGAALRALKRYKESIAAYEAGKELLFCGSSS